MELGRSCRRVEISFRHPRKIVDVSFYSIGFRLYVQTELQGFFRRIPIKWPNYWLFHILPT